MRRRATVPSAEDRKDLHACGRERRQRPELPAGRAVALVVALKRLYPAQNKIRQEEERGRDHSCFKIWRTPRGEVRQSRLAAKLPVDTWRQRTRLRHTPWLPPGIMIRSLLHPRHDVFSHSTWHMWGKQRGHQPRRSTGCRHTDALGFCRWRSRFAIALSSTSLLVGLGPAAYLVLTITF